MCHRAALCPSGRVPDVDDALCGDVTPGPTTRDLADRIRERVSR